MQEIIIIFIPNFHSNCYSISEVKVKFVTLKLELKGQMEASLVCVSLYILPNAIDYKQNKIKNPNSIIMYCSGGVHINAS